MELELASLEQITEELARRFRDVVIIVQGEKVGEPSVDHIRLRYHGSDMACIGMLAWSKHYLLNRQP